MVSSYCLDGENYCCPVSGSGSGSDRSSFFCVDLMPSLGCCRCPSMVDYYLVRYFCTRSDDRPGKEVKKFFVITLTHQD